MANVKGKEPDKRYNEIDYIINGIVGKEKVYLDELGLIRSEATEDYPLYKSEIIMNNKVFDIYVKFNVGRKTTNFMHTIITTDGNRVSLGFSNQVVQVKKNIMEYVKRYALIQ